MFGCGTADRSDRPSLATDRRISRNARGQQSSRSATGISEPERPDRRLRAADGRVIYSLQRVQIRHSARHPFLDAFGRTGRADGRQGKFPLPPGDAGPVLAAAQWRYYHRAEEDQVAQVMPSQMLA
jgi:hypothetical protein